MNNFQRITSLTALAVMALAPMALAQDNRVVEPASTADVTAHRNTQSKRALALPTTAVGLSSADLNNWPLVTDQACGKQILMDYWTWAEPTKGTFNWKYIDAEVALCSARGVPIIFTFGGVPKWAAQPGATCGTNYCAGPPANQGDLNAFVTAVATRYKGEFAMIEEWNEPDSPGQFESIQVVGAAKVIADLIAMDKAIYTTYHAIDPDVQFSTPGVQDNTAYKFQVDNIKALLNAETAQGGIWENAVAFHWYPRTGVGGDCTPSTILTCVAALPANIAAVQAVSGGRPVLLTESSWGPDTQIPSAEQPAFAKSWVDAVQNGHIVGIWWGWQTAGQASDAEGTLYSGSTMQLNAAGQAFTAAVN
jgi:hypothetical protein